VTGVIEISPVSKEIQCYAKQVLMDGQRTARWPENNVPSITAYNMLQDVNTEELSSKIQKCTIIVYYTKLLFNKARA